MDAVTLSVEHNIPFPHPPEHEHVVFGRISDERSDYADGEILHVPRKNVARVNVRDDDHDDDDDRERKKSFALAVNTHVQKSYDARWLGGCAALCSRDLSCLFGDITI